MDKVIKFIVDNIGTGNFDRKTAVQLMAMLKINNSGKPKDAATGSLSRNVKDIAIIGISVKLPLAEDIDGFWENVRRGMDCVGEFPCSRQHYVEQYLGYRGISLDDLEYVPGAYLGEIDTFDHKYFRISPREASLTDPNQRLFLQTAWQAFEDAGYGGKRASGSRTGVYLGFSTNLIDTYSRVIYEIDPALLPMAIVGNTAAVITGRVSYLLDLKGPSMVIDTACSSSLVAIHEACEAMRNGDCDMAVAGGIKLISMPVCRKGENSGIGMESSDGRTRAFDDNSDGTGSGEGVIAMLLKPLEKAVQDRDNIYAVIKGSASNQDGNSAGLTAPNPAAQVDVILKAWERAGIDPETISYIEAHGTGTQLGDPIEVKAINDAFKIHTNKKQFCALGSVKTNVGHLSEAAGVLGLLKTVMALKNREIPPQKYFNRPNRKIDFADSAVYVNTKPVKWKKHGIPFRCCVSGFGMSGTNCHIVLEEAPKVEAAADTDTGCLNILTLSAKSEIVLKQLVADYQKFIDKEDIGGYANVCYTANTGRGHYNYRLVILIKEENDLRQKIKTLNEIDYTNTSEKWFWYGRHKTVSASRKPEAAVEIITEEEKAELNLIVKNLTGQFVGGGKCDRGLLEEICRLYAQGADIAWEDLYTGEARRRVSVPVYPFEPVKCWLDIPEAENRIWDNVAGGEMYYQPVWLREDLRVSKALTGTVLIFKDDRGLGEEIARRLRSAGREVIEVGLGAAFTAIDAASFAINPAEADYLKLIEAISARGVSQVIHLFTAGFREEINEFAELEESQQRGIYSLFYLIRAILNCGLTGEVDVLLISNNVFAITGAESGINPENAPLFGLGRVVGREYPNLSCRCIDLDAQTSVAEIMPEIAARSGTYQVAYRKGKRYVEEFRDIDIEYIADEPVEIKENGVYVITGGTGGMGLEMARYLAAKARINLVLVSRSGLPERHLWENIVHEGKDTKLCRKLRNIMELEPKCSDITCWKADIADIGQVKEITGALKKKYGEINGLIHCAGLAGDGYLVRKDAAAFNDVIRPKIYGTWAFDRFLRAEALDFYVMCSSVATTLSGAGQGDYVAANAYLDAYACYRNRRAGKTQTINWATWKETGMAVDYGVNVDTIFKAITTKKAIHALDRIFNKDIRRVVVGEVNYGSEFLCLFEDSPLRLSYKLNHAVETAKKKFGGGLLSGHKKGTWDVKITGKDGGEDYDEVENKLARIYSEILGFCELNIHDSFFELGGDSVLLGRMHILLEKEFPGRVKFIDLFEYTSIYKLARYLNNTDVKSKVRITAKGEDLETDLTRIIDNLEKGGLSIDEAVASLKNI